MKHKGLTRNYALRKIALFAVELILLTAGTLTLVSAIYYSRFTSSACEEDARRFRADVNEIFTAFEMNDMAGEEDKEYYEAVRSYMREMCKLSGAKYTYMFTADRDSTMMKYVMCAAADDEEDETTKVERGFGVEADRGDGPEIEEAIDGKFAGPERFKNEYGDVLAYYFPMDSLTSEGKKVIAGIDFDITKVREDAIKYVITTVLIVTLVLSAVLALLLAVLSKKVFAPIKRISVQMNSFDPEKEHAKLNLNSYHEIEEINASFNKLSDDIIGYISNLRRMTAERAQSAAELGIARRIQIGMVPPEFSLSGTGYDLFAGAVPAKEVGGDFYDCFESGDNVFFVIGDVSGKGIAAALFMTMSRNLIREKLRSGLSPADALNYANDELCRENPEGMFVTVFAAVLDTRTGELIYANAGHTRPLLTSAEEKRFLIPDTGIALGLFEDSGIINEVTLLSPGSSITVYTDGITEAVSVDKQLFGEERLPEAAEDGTAAEISASITKAVRRFAEGCEQSDDMTIVTLRFTGSDELKTETLPAGMESVAVMRNTLLEMTGDSSMKRKLILACEELLVNIVEYSGTEEILMTAARRGSILTVRFEDGGTPFDPFSNIPKEKDFDEYDSGGMGIRMVTQLAESCSFNNLSGKNITTVSFVL